MTKHVVYATDENYWMPLYVSIHSLLSNNTDCEFEIFVLHDVKGENYREFVENTTHLSDIHDSHNISFVEIDETSFDTAPLPGRFTKPAYYRLLVDELPVRNETVLWLDCDIIVDKNIRSLFETDLDNYVAGAVPAFRKVGFHQGIPIHVHNIQTGVLLINLSNWEAENVKERCIDFIESNEGEFNAPLQKVINSVLHSEVRHLEPEYNLTMDWAKYIEDNDIEFPPKIIHYTTHKKPWLYRYHMPFKETWWSYLNETPYSSYTPPDKRLKCKIAKPIQSCPLIYNNIKYLYSLLK